LPEADRQPPRGVPAALAAGRYRLPPARPRPRAPTVGSRSGAVGDAAAGVHGAVHSAGTQRADRRAAFVLDHAGPLRSGASPAARPSLAMVLARLRGLRPGGDHERGRLPALADSASVARAAAAVPDAVAGRLERSRCRVAVGGRSPLPPVADLLLAAPDAVARPGRRIARVRGLPRRHPAPADGRALRRPVAPSQ